MLFAAVLAFAHFTLTRTPFGRQIYAIGADAEAAQKAGLDTRRILLGVYLIGGMCAALGGTSLFGGRGRVFPGTVIGALLIQSVKNGLVILNADPYLYPLITSAIIFLAVLLDSVRNRMVARLGQRKIRVEAV